MGGGGDPVHEGGCAPLVVRAAAVCVRGSELERGTHCPTLLPRPTDHALTTQEKRQSSAEAVAGRQAAMLYQIEELEAADAKRREVEEMMAQACILSVVALSVGIVSRDERSSRCLHRPRCVGSVYGVCMHAWYTHCLLYTSPSPRD